MSFSNVSWPFNKHRFRHFYTSPTSPLQNPQGKLTSFSQTFRSEHFLQCSQYSQYSFHSFSLIFIHFILHFTFFLHSLAFLSLFSIFATRFSIRFRIFIICIIFIISMICHYMMSLYVYYLESLCLHMLTYAYICSHMLTYAHTVLYNTIVE